MSSITKPILLDETYEEKMDALAALLVDEDDNSIANDLLQIGGEISNVAASVGGIDETLLGIKETLEGDLLDGLAEINGTLNSNLSDIAIAVGAEGTLSDWGSIQYAVRRGNIGKYLQVGDQLNVTMEETVYPNAVSDGLTVSVNADTFLSYHGTAAGFFLFVYNGSVWKLDDNTVSLENYGITVTGRSLVENDKFTIIVSAANNAFDVEGIDEEISVRNDDDHVLSLMLHSMIWPRLFDPPQYLIAVTRELLNDIGVAASSSEMPAGTYNITFRNASYDGTHYNVRVKFTTTIPIPIGGGIRHEFVGQRYDTGYDENGQVYGNNVHFITYDADTITELERVVSYQSGSSDQSSGTALGTTTAGISASDISNYHTKSYLNFTIRQFYGSNRWSTSYIRQLLNSSDNVLNFVPATIFSRNDTIAREGFLHLIDPELKAVLTKVRKRYALYLCDNEAGSYASGAYEDVEDYITLDTLLDVVGAQVSSVNEGPVDSNGTVKRTAAMSLWTGTTWSDRIKYNAVGAPRQWWLGSIGNLTSANNGVVATVTYSATNGGIGQAAANNSVIGIAPRIHIG